MKQRKKSRYAVSRYAVTPLRVLLTALCLSFTHNRNKLFDVYNVKKKAVY